MKMNYLIKLIFGAVIFSMICLSCSNRSQLDKQVIHVDVDSLYEQILEDSILVTGLYYVTETDNGFKRQLDKTDELYFLDPKPILIKEYFGKLDISEGLYSGYEIEILIKKQYVSLWADATEKAIGSRIGFVIDNQLVYAPYVNTKIHTGRVSLNRPEYSKEELEEFMGRLR